MNVFRLDDDPARAAMALCDKHVVKMIVESAQVLSTAIWLNGGHPILKPTHAAHPVVRFAASSRQGYDWILAHMEAMLAEYTFRYGRSHAYDGYPGYFRVVAKLVPDASLPWPLAMPDEYRRDDPTEAYRAYYSGDKRRFARWLRGRPCPDWW